MSGPLQPAQSGAAMRVPFDLSDEALRALFVDFITPYEWIKLPAVNKQCLRVVTAILQEPAPCLFRLVDDERRPVDVDLRTPVSFGRSSLTADVCPLGVLNYVSKQGCRVVLSGSAPMEFLLTTSKSPNGILISRNGADWDLVPPLASALLRLGDRFALEAGPGPLRDITLSRSLFELGCLRAPNLAHLTVGTQPNYMEDDDAPGITRWESVQAQHWAVYGCDNKDAKGIENVLLAEHSDGKAQEMVRHAFPELSEPQVSAFVDMDAYDVWDKKSGGSKADCVADMWTTKEEIEALAEEHGEGLRVWFCGRGGDRLVQSSMLDGWVNPTRTRPTTYNELPAKWDELGIRKSPNWEAQVAAHKVKDPTQPSRWRCNSVCLPSTASGRATYRAELWRGDHFVTHFYIGIYPHPASLSWSDVESRPDDHRKFLNDLADGNPSQEHVVKFNANMVD